LRRIVALSDLFLVRDDASLRQCRGTSATLTDDLVFSWKILPPRAVKVEPRARPVVAVTVSPPAWREPAGRPAMAGLADAIRAWQTRGYKIVLMVFQQTATTTDDRAIFARLLDVLGVAASADIEIRCPSANADAIAQAFADIDVISGMRFHALVLATMLGRPFVGIASDNKIREICRRFDMPCLEAASLSGSQLADAVEAVRDRVPDPRLVERASQDSRENFRAFAALEP
jgi:polysaccharide pyruvyl transferase WcaK-like protein